ncbi:deoxyhypusine monooxygenase [Saprolegnia diclina VS20]|uniref:Deoxyhypusine hydroxylase n=1 Tax=Saprolegnia diclina (strain VS20) TaxID=1156394 RepID=T0QBQ5_SAPDV|nr:deoxyhypusine monooxygenase [Saprolegnia diclina VS20]EQC32136.1 deoxyhypusine monooxygenase [Saprolegnia diclina VS20]|eukprot:XP_008614538.1 deoxyhypusine monooxygenase [Saprolegnia diclina VS20]
MSDGPSFDQLRASLLDLSQPMGKRTRAVFYLRTRGGKDDLKVLLEALVNKADSELMRHELAYVIGQFQDADACPTLESVVADTSDDCMVRHEAAEALGAIGDASSLEILEKFSHDDAPEVAETCELALRLVKYKHTPVEDEGVLDRNPYLSVDPAPAMEKTKTTDELKAILLDTSRSMFDRYRAMFSLRNRNSEDAALALGEAFDDKSALFRHEIAYVMGQMVNPVTVPALKKVLVDASEHRMVRHEAAEALGAIGTPECEEILKVYVKDDHQVVRESCEVALDIIDYWAPMK